jgi:hypothetical protein
MLIWFAIRAVLLTGVPGCLAGSVWRVTGRLVEKVKSAPPTASGVRVTRHPQMGAADNFRLTSVNVHGISELGGRGVKNGRFPRLRA